MKNVCRAGYVAAAILLLALPAFGAESTQAQSMFETVKKGVHWPSYLIFAGSITALTLIVEHFLTVRTASISPTEQVKQVRALIESRNLREAVQGLRKSQTFFAKVMTAAVQHFPHGFDAMHEAALEKSGELSGRMFRKVEYLNILGNLGPLLGLLGTVLGMIEAFGALGAGGGSGGAGGLATGISQALVNTMLGLALAIVGLGFFGLCRNRVDSLTVSATVDVLDVLEYFRPSKKKAAEGTPATATA
jgi:biopolymer transport protein ExbB